MWNCLMSAARNNGDLPLCLLQSKQRRNPNMSPHHSIMQSSVHILILHLTHVHAWHSRITLFLCSFFFSQIKRADINGLRYELFLTYKRKPPHLNYCFCSPAFLGFVMFFQFIQSVIQLLSPFLGRERNQLFFSSQRIRNMNDGSSLAG